MKKNLLFKNLVFMLLIVMSSNFEIVLGSTSTSSTSMLDPNDVPAAPTELVACSSGPTSLALTWKDNSSDEEGFRIERSTDGSVFTEIGTVSADSAIFNSANLNIFTVYYYRVIAYNSSGDSEASNVASSLSTQYRAYSIAEPPMIDGVLDEYEDYQAITITSEGLKGEGVYWITYDTAAIYIAGTVSDPKLAAVITEDDDWHSYADDGLEVHFDTYHNAGESLQGDDYKITVNILNKHCEQNGKSFDWDGPYESAIVEDGTINEEDEGDVGYTIEIAMPWSSMSMDAPSENDTIGFDFLMNQRTDAGSQNQVWWANTNGDSPNQPEGYGDLIFMGEPASGTVYVKPNFKIDYIDTYPNPVNSVLSIMDKTNGIDAYKIEIYNIVGKLEYSSEKKVQLPYTVDMSEMPSGIHLLKIYQPENNSAYIKKIIKR